MSEASSRYGDPKHDEVCALVRLASAASLEAAASSSAVGLDSPGLKNLISGAPSKEPPLHANYVGYPTNLDEM